MSVEARLTSKRPKLCHVGGRPRQTASLQDADADSWGSAAACEGAVVCLRSCIGALEEDDLCVGARLHSSLQPVGGARVETAAAAFLA